MLASNSVTDSLLKLADITNNARSVFSNFSINGNSKSNYGIYSDDISHATFEKLLIIGTLESAISISNGWCNDVVNCELSYNKGNGLTSISGNSNMVNILNNRIFLNGGIGVLLIAGIAIRIQGNTIETNKKAGILIGTGTEGLSITGNYFEANSDNGITFETPNILIQGDIIINGSAYPVETIASSYPVTGGSIKNNTFSYTGADTVIQLIGAKNINIENNTEHALNGLKNLVSTNGNTERYITENIKISNNIGFKKQLNVTDILPYRQMRLSSYEISNTPKRNFFKDDYIIISSLSGGTISDSDLLFDGLPTKVITGVVGSSDIFGFKIDISDYPSLKNKTF